MCFDYALRIAHLTILSTHPILVWIRDVGKMHIELSLLLKQDPLKLNVSMIINILNNSLSLICLSQY